MRVSQRGLNRTLPGAAWFGHTPLQSGRIETNRVKSRGRRKPAVKIADDLGCSDKAPAASCFDGRRKTRELPRSRPAKDGEPFQRVTTDDEMGGPEELDRSESRRPRPGREDASRLLP